MCPSDFVVCRLTPREKEVFDLVNSERFPTYAEVAAELGVSTSHVRQLYFNALDSIIYAAFPFIRNYDWNFLRELGGCRESLEFYEYAMGVVARRRAIKGFTSKERTATARPKGKDDG